MQHLKVFVKQGCQNCPAAKEVANRFPRTEVYDIDQVEGLAEAAFYSVLCTPSIVVVDENGTELYAWRCTVPSPREIAEWLN
ncbi:MAG: thioredoxin family protein [Actinomycetota bacterium]